MIALAIFHAAFASVVFAELVERPTKLKSVSWVSNTLYAAVYLSKAMS